MRKFIFLSVLLLLCIVCQLVFFIYVVISYDRRASRFRVEEKMFRNAVEFACTNYLASYLGTFTNELVATQTVQDVQVKLVPLSTWADFYGRFSCMIEGSRYVEGDYSPYGKIVRIADGRVYCFGEGQYTILRRSNEDFSRSRPRPGSRSDPGEDGDRESAL